MKVAPFHSSEKMEVYHTCTTCTEGDNIKPENKVQGTGELLKCAHCMQLEEDGKC